MRDAKYWADRALNEVLMGERSVLDYENALLQAYTIALREIKKDIDAFFTRYANQHKISYAEARKRLTVIELKEFKALVDKWLREATAGRWSSEYIKYLEKLLGAKYVSRLEMLEADVRYQIENIEHGKHIDMTELMSINYLAAFYERSYTIAHGAEIAVRFNAVTKAGVEKAVKTKWSQYNYSQTIWNDRDRLVRTLSTVIPQSFSRGLSSNQLGDMIAKEMDASRNRGRTLARTEVNYICNQADLDAYKIAEVEEYEYLATLDLRTSDICRSMDGTIHKVSHAKVGVNFPPMHPNCRSTTIPHFADQVVEDRVARDEEGYTIRVPRKMTQEEYINTYVPEEDRDRLLRFRKKFYKTE
jgi:SPP1 gp7 family putative phage head morphogenesis protein